VVVPNQQQLVSILRRVYVKKRKTKGHDDDVIIDTPASRVAEGLSLVVRCRHA
jgi:hypothetical protein